MKNIKILLAIIATVVFVAIIVLVQNTVWPEPVPTSELPDGYSVSSYCLEEGNENVVLSTALGEGDRIIPIKGSGIEVGLFSSSNPDVDILLQDEGGYWIIFTSFSDDGEREVEGIKWWSENLRPGDKVVLPTKKDVTVTFVGFDYDSREDKFIPMFTWK